jgi:hypothetical protein
MNNGVFCDVTPCGSYNSSCSDTVLTRKHLKISFRLHEKLSILIEQNSHIYCHVPGRVTTITGHGLGLVRT